jgi:hypothetical protein
MSEVNGMDNPNQEADLSRRALLRGATVAVPTILTLHSGAALARSSNLIGAAPNASAEGNKLRCLDTSSVYRTEKPNVFDLGEDPMAHVTTIRTNKQYFRPGNNDQPSNNSVGGQQMCSNGGRFFRKDGNSFTRVRVKRGVLVSATALSSFANDITYTDV